MIQFWKHFILIVLFTESYTSAFEVTRSTKDLVYGAKQQCRSIWGNENKEGCLCRYPYTFMSRGWEGSWCTTPRKVGCRISLNGNRDEAVTVETNTKMRISTFLPRRCHSIAELYVWNMLNPYWIIGKWEKIPFEFINRHFRIHRNGFRVYLSVHDLDTNAWSGHVIKVVFKHCYQCSIIKVHGNRHYPFDTHEFHRSICPYHHHSHDMKEQTTVAPKPVNTTLKVTQEISKIPSNGSFHTARSVLSTGQTFISKNMSKSLTTLSYVESTSSPTSKSGTDDKSDRHSHKKDDHGKVFHSNSTSLTHILIIVFGFIIIISLFIARITFFIYHKPKWSFQLPHTELKINPKLEAGLRKLAKYKEYDYTSLKETKGVNTELKGADSFFGSLDQSDYNEI